MEYRKKPIVIEAFRYGIDSRPDWFDTKVTSNEIITYVGTDIRDSSQYYCEIKTLEGIMRGNCGDYIIKGVKGEVYACKPDIFEMTYELAKTSSQTDPSDAVTRLEIIDKQGRVYSQWNCTIQLSYQDDGKTLKIFVNN